MKCPDCGKPMKESGFVTVDTPGTTTKDYICKARGCPVMRIMVLRSDKDEIKKVEASKV